MGDLDDNLSVGGKRPPIDHMTLGDAEAAMHKGRGGMLVAAGVVLLAAIGGLVFLMGGHDEHRVYSEMGKTINGERVGSFDQFWGCVLSGENLRDLKSNEDVVALVERRAAGGGARYAKQLRDDCLPKLEGVEPKLGALILPPDLKPSVAALLLANGDLRGATSNFISYLDQPELVYDEEESREKIGKMARGWYDFRKAIADVNKVLKEHLDP